MERKRLTEGVIWKQLLLFALPILIGNVFQQLYTTVDAMVVGRHVSHQAMTAVGSNNSMVLLIISFFTGLSVGSGVIISQHFGAKSEKRLGEAVHTAFAISLICGVAFTAVGLLLSPAILRWMKTPDDVMALALQYLRIYFAGIISLTVYNMGASVIRATGDSVRPLIYLIVSSAVNIALNLLFVIVFRWGVAGVGWATLASQTLSAVLVTARLLRAPGAWRLTLRRLRIYPEVFSDVVRIGLPSGGQSMVIQLSNTIIQANINAFGSTVMAGFTGASKTDGFLLMFANSFGMAMTTFVGQNLGAGQKERAKAATRTGLAVCAMVTLAAGLLMYLFRTPLLLLYTDKPEVIEWGRRLLGISLPFYWIFAVSAIFSGVIRGTGRTLPVMIISMTMMCGVRILWIYGLLNVWNDARVVMWSYPVTWLLTSAAYAVYYKKSRCIDNFRMKSKKQL